MSALRGTPDQQGLMPRVYLAGPEVFLPDAMVRAEADRALCRAWGFTPLHPLDHAMTAAGAIYQANVALLRQADAVLASLGPFRGPEADPGTAFELGFAVALGKPVIGYHCGAESQWERVSRLYGPLQLSSDGGARDRAGAQVEDFGLPVNLMLAVPCHCVAGGLVDALRCLRALWEHGDTGKKNGDPEVAEKRED